MVIASALVTQLARRLRRDGPTPTIVACLTLLLVLVAAVAASDLLGPTSEPIIAAPLRW